jgi:hypothetical protein
MKTTCLILAALTLLPLAVVAADDSAKAEQLAQEVWQAAGGPNWPEVKAIDFTFAVVKDGKTVARAQHHWDVAAQTDHVQWKDKDVTVNLANPGSDENAKAAYARWTNDSYWLLMPLKLRDRGLHVTSEGMKEMDGAKREVLHLSFDKVGLTPGDNYRLYIDPASKRVISWDYMPEPGKSMHGSWDGYEKSGGLTLATEHKMDDVEIKILDLKVTAAK